MVLTRNATEDLTIRRGRIDDISALLKICRDGFTDSARWQGPKSLGQRWLEIALKSQEVELWVSCFKNDSVGFCVLVIDEIQWKRKKQKRRGNLFLWFLNVFIHPKLMLYGIVKKLRLIKPLKNKVSSCDDDSLNSSTRLWIELIAVLPNFQGKDVGKKMLKVCETRASELRRKLLTLNVEKSNMQAIKFYERCGFNCMREKTSNCLYTKIIQSSNELS